MELGKFLLLLVLGVVVAQTLGDRFDDYEVQFNKKYKDKGEKEKRKAIFQANMNRADSLNQQAIADGKSERYGPTQFSDMDDSELNSFTGFKPSASGILKQSIQQTPEMSNIRRQAVASSLDWSTQGVVWPPKNQGQCGSCWAFSVVSVLESFNAIKTKSLISLSEQQLVDCNTANAGCNGGDPYAAFTYEKTNGAQTSASYPYKAVSQTCQYSATQPKVYPKTFAFAKDETTMMNMLATYGPMSVAIFVNNTLFSYTSGIVTLANCPASSPNHAVQLVGYGVSNGKAFWKLKNSWGTSWGEGGYFRLARNTNTCNIKSYAIYVTS